MVGRQSGWCDLTNMARKRKAGVKAPPRKKTKAPVRRVRRRNRARATRSRVSAYARLIADPCMGPLVRAVGGDAGSNIIERVRTTLTFPNLNNNKTSGYLVWFPGFHNSGSGLPNSAGNLFAFECSTADLGVRPLNNSLSPLGSPYTAAERPSGRFHPDPANAAIASTSPFSRARTIAACMQLETVGNMSNVRGLICSVVNISLQTFNALSGSTQNYTPPSVGEMLSYAAKRERLNIDGHEVVWGPNEYDASFRTNGDEERDTTFLPNNVDSNIAFQQGNPSVSPTLCPSPNPGACMGILIAWTSLYGEYGTISINCTKVVELELAPRGLAVEQNIAPAASGGTLISEIVTQLDTNAPGWRAHAVRAATSAASRLTGAVLAGTGYVGQIGRQALRIMDGEL